VKIIIEKSKPKAFVICPVRNIEPDYKKKLEHKINELEKDYDIYYPSRDTNQFDETGYSICLANRDAIKKAKVVFVAWDGKSYGSHFDLGVAFAYHKKIIPILDEFMPEKTSGKSFQNMILEWAKLYEKAPCDIDWSF